MNILIYLVLNKSPDFPLEKLPSPSLFHVVHSELISILTPYPTGTTNFRSEEMTQTCPEHSILQARMIGSGHITQTKPKWFDPKTLVEATDFGWGDQKRRDTLPTLQID